jgi:hypothetical protein
MVSPTIRKAAPEELGESCHLFDTFVMQFNKNTNSINGLDARFYNETPRVGAPR